MKKSFKKFLILSQVLGWSALVASACTEEQIKTTSKTIANSKSKDNTAAQSDQTESSTNKNPSTNDSQTSDASQSNTQSLADKSKGQRGTTSSSKIKSEEAQDMPQKHSDGQAEQHRQTGSPSGSNAGTNEKGTVKGAQASNEQDPIKSPQTPPGNKGVSQPNHVNGQTSERTEEQTTAASGGEKDEKTKAKPGVKTMNNNGESDGSASGEEGKAKASEEKPTAPVPATVTKEHHDEQTSTIHK